ncbi:DUF4038 domain-containing protein [Cellulomonas marina]|uniref:apiosidase-like domain-containing protein n=1 Tax=Cellulomonas marina TaxID=988821 RepID=UPI001587510B|nr:DUF4038 domain-containing protein [Cellulomonas marina]
MRVNVGGDAYRDSRGRTWAADTGYVGGRPTNVAAEGHVRGTKDHRLYRDLRVGMDGYRLALPSGGTWRVTLHLLENYHEGDGRRVFSVDAEGERVVHALDLHERTGHGTAHTVAFDVEVRDGALDLGFEAHVDLATLSAVAAVPVTAAAPTAPTSPAFPLRASADGDHLVTADGEPFLYLADTAWMAPTRLDQAGVRRWLDARVAQGFTAVQVSLLHFVGQQDEGPANVYGDLPFVGGYDLSRPLEVGERTRDARSPDYDYWDHVAYVLDEAAARGLAVAVVPSWYGYGGEDWRARETTGNATDYGAFLGRRLGAMPHLVWLLGGDNAPTGDVAKVAPGADRSDKLAATDAMAAAIRAHEPVRHLMTYHGRRGVTSSAYVGDREWHTLNNPYADQHVHEHAPAAFGTGIPSVVTEAYYDGRDRAPFLDRTQLRAQAWWAVLSGAGFAYGHEDVWDLDAAWGRALRASSAADVGRVATILDAHPRLRPAPVPLTSGEGASSPGSRALSGRSSSGALLTYLPTARTVTVDLAAAASGGSGGDVRLSWVDPASGDVRDEGRHAATGTRDLAVPRGWDDALLVAEPVTA